MTSVTEISTVESYDVRELNRGQIARCDPVLSLLSKSPSPIAIGVAYPILFTLVRMLAAWRAGHLQDVAHAGGTLTGFFNDPALYIFLVIGIIIWGYYAWVPRGIVDLFNGLYLNKVVGKARKGEDYKYASFVESLRTSFSKGWWSVVIVVLSAVIVIFFLLPGYIDRYHSQDSWSMADPFNLLLSALWVFTGLYTILLLLSFFARAVFWVRRLFSEFVITVRPLHPDGAGGLSPLGKFTSRLSLFSALIAIALLATPLTRRYLAVGTIGFDPSGEIVKIAIGAAAYTIAIPLVFGLPLLSVHAHMKKAKEEHLAQISERLEAEYNSIQAVLEGEGTDAEKHLSNLTALQILYDASRNFPEWPWSAEGLRRFNITWVSPLLITVLAEILVALLLR